MSQANANVLPGVNKTGPEGTLSWLSLRSGRRRCAGFFFGI